MFSSRLRMLLRCGTARDSESLQRRYLHLWFQQTDRWQRGKNLERSLVQRTLRTMLRRAFATWISYAMDGSSLVQSSHLQALTWLNVSPPVVKSWLKHHRDSASCQKILGADLKGRVDAKYMKRAFVGWCALPARTRHRSLQRHKLFRAQAWYN